MTEINNRGKRLITELSTSCEARRKVFDQQMQEIERLERTIQHCYKFTEQAASTDNDSALLYSRKLIVQQLVLLLRTMCTRQPVAGLDIRFLRNEQNMMNLVGRLGMLVIRDPLNKNQPQQAAAAAAAAAVAASQTRPGHQLTQSQIQALQNQQKINLHQLMMRRQNSGDGSVHIPNGPRMVLPSGHVNGPHVVGPTVNGPQMRPSPAYSTASSFSGSSNSGMIQLSPTPPNQAIVRPSSHPVLIRPAPAQVPRPSSIPQHMVMQRTGAGDIILSGGSTPNSASPIISPPGDTSPQGSVELVKDSMVKVKEEPKTPMEERPSCSMVDSSTSRFIPNLGDGDRQRATGSTHR